MLAADRLTLAIDIQSRRHLTAARYRLRAACRSCSSRRQVNVIFGEGGSLGG
jgi:hypothetical protein